MNIYYTDSYGRRRLQDCNLSELEVKGIEASDGVDTYKMYTIYNDVDSDCAEITFGGKARIAGNLRDAFWQSVAATFKNNIPIFDVDEWFANVKFISAQEAARKKKKKRK